MIPMAEVEEVKEVKEVEEKTARSSPVRTYSDLLVYKQAYRLALEVSRFTRSSPAREQFELARQLRDSSRSIAANIVEGWAKRHSPAEFKRHLVIATGECAETRFWLELAADEGLGARKAFGELQAEYSKLGMMLHRLWKAWRKL